MSSEAGTAWLKWGAENPGGLANWPKLAFLVGFDAGRAAELDEMEAVDTKIEKALRGALDAAVARAEAAETEWEYEYASHWEDHGWVKDSRPFRRRRKAGPWQPVLPEGDE